VPPRRVLLSGFQKRRGWKESRCHTATARVAVVRRRGGKDPNQDDPGPIIAPRRGSSVSGRRTPSQASRRTIGGSLATPIGSLRRRVAARPPRTPPTARLSPVVLVLAGEMDKCLQTLVGTGAQFVRTAADEIGRKAKSVGGRPRWRSRGVMSSICPGSSRSTCGRTIPLPRLGLRRFCRFVRRPLWGTTPRRSAARPRRPWPSRSASMPEADAATGVGALAGSPRTTATAGGGGRRCGGNPRCFPRALVWPHGMDDAVHRRPNLPVTPNHRAQTASLPPRG